MLNLLITLTEWVSSHLLAFGFFVASCWVIAWAFNCLKRIIRKHLGKKICAGQTLDPAEIAWAVYYSNQVRLALLFNS